MADTPSVTLELGGVYPSAAPLRYLVRVTAFTVVYVRLDRDRDYQLLHPESALYDHNRDVIDAAREGLR